MKRQNALQRMTDEQKQLEYERFWQASNEEFFTSVTIAIALKKSVDWLQKKRCSGNGIPFVKTGHKSVAYKKQDVLEYLERQKLTHTGA